MILLALLEIVLPILAHARHQARIRQNNHPVRGIQMALVLYAQSRNPLYPGLDTLGRLDTLEDGGGDGQDPD